MVFLPATCCSPRDELGRVESGLARSFWGKIGHGSAHNAYHPVTLSLILQIVNVWYSVNGERLGTYMGHTGAVWCVDADCILIFVLSLCSQGLPAMEKLLT